MPPYKLATTVWHTSLLPRDGAMINPIINSTVAGNDVEVLVNEWLTAFIGWSNLSTTAQVTCKAYDVSKPKPNYPLAEVTRNPGVFATAAMPREIALCLSFYATNNVKRQRGRLYVPLYWMGSVADVALRPSTTIRTKLGQLAPILQDLGGIDDDWSVWSKVDGMARAVTNWWVDDEWDIQRRRGLRATTRTEGTTSEESLTTRALV